MKLLKSALFVLILFLPACSGIVLEPSDFAWPVESVIKVNDDGTIEEKRYSLSFDAKNLFLAETGDSLAYLDRELRIIRDQKGYYYMTAERFKNIYVFNVSDGKFSLSTKIEIAGEEQPGLTKPAFNQRPPFIELLNGDQKIMISNEGIKEDE